MSQQRESQEMFNAWLAINIHFNYLKYLKKPGREI